jgi:uncharacterized protein with NAD-binding domain and iron-sulfur cluster
MGALSTAWKLSDPALGGQYEVTVLQRDGLLGGKGASTRNADPELGRRIEEHGIHVLLGFYDNTLTLLRDCYDELAANGTPGALPFDEALTPWDEVTLSEKTPGGWRFQTVPFPTNSMPFGGTGSPTPVPVLVANVVAWFVFFLNQLGTSVSPPAIAWLGTLVLWLVRLLVFLGRLGLPVWGLFVIVRIWIDAIVSGMWTIVAPLVGLDPRVRWLWMALWFAGTNLRGIIDAGILADTSRFDDLNGQDYAEWLHSISVVSPPAELAWDSAPVRAAYDIAFSYGHPLEAGVVLYNLLLIGVGYSQHFAYKMNAGMGEVVFVPLHHALEARGVQFRFHDEVTAIRSATDADGLHVAEIDVVQKGIGLAASDLFTQETVSLSGGTSATLDAWADPAPTSLATAPVTTLVKGVDFDVAVLGISVGALPPICADLAAADPAFAAMLELQTVATQSIQLWLDADLPTLGWTGSPSAGAVSFERPFQSWLDMSQVLDREVWVGTKPRSVAYFSDEYQPDETGQPPDEVVFGRLESFVTNHLPSLLPGFTLDHLHAPAGVYGVDRLTRQYWRANLDASNRYVICGVGTNGLRLAPDGTAFRNLALAGDWVRTHLNTGCLEAATTAGFGAADAILENRVTA